MILTGLFMLVYLRGRMLQKVFSGAGEVLKEKKKKQDLIACLIGGNISLIDATQGRESSVHISDARSIQKFKKSLEKSEVCKLRKKNRQKGPIFEIYVSGDKYVFDSYLSPPYQEDVFVKLLEKNEKYYIKFPGLKGWLDENC